MLSLKRNGFLSVYACASGWFKERRKKIVYRVYICVLDINIGTTWNGVWNRCEPAGWARVAMSYKSAKPNRIIKHTPTRAYKLLRLSEAASYVYVCAVAPAVARSRERTVLLFTYTLLPGKLVYIQVHWQRQRCTRTFATINCIRNIIVDSWSNQCRTNCDCAT